MKQQELFNTIFSKLPAYILEDLAKEVARVERAKEVDQTMKDTFINVEGTLKTPQEAKNLEAWRLVLSDTADAVNTAEENLFTLCKVVEYELAVKAYTASWVDPDAARLHLDKNKDSRLIDVHGQLWRSVSKEGRQVYEDKYETKAPQEPTAGVERVMDVLSMAGR